MQNVTRGLLVKLPMVHGKGSEIEQLFLPFVQSVQTNAVTALFALRFWPSEYGIFCAFPDDASRDAFRANVLDPFLGARSGDLFREPPKPEHLDILASKLPESLVAPPDTKGLLLTFEPKSGHIADVEEFLRNAKAIVEQEPATTAWFAIHLESGPYGIFDVFPDEAGRFKHLTGGVAQQLAIHALALLGSFPEPALPSVIGEHFAGSA